MKKLILIVSALCLIVYSCKTEKKEAVAETAKKELNILEKVAYAHGYEQWKDVKEIQFTFNVDRDTSHFERSWIWKTNTNTITSITASDTLVYRRSTMDSTALKTNGGFINDRYWILAPFNLMWDKDNITYEHVAVSEAPISKTPMQKLTIVYGNEGGYTPGDAYDFYFGEDYLLKEWVFRQANQEAASLATTWEDYITKEKLQLARMHKNENGSFKLYFTGVEVAF